MRDFAPTTAPVEVRHRWQAEGLWTDDTFPVVAERGLAGNRAGRARVLSAVRPYDGTVGDLADRGARARYLPSHSSIEALKDAVAEAPTDAIVSRAMPVTAEVMDAAGALKVISKYGVGVDNIDLRAAAERGVVVMRAYGTNARSVAELALTMMRLGCVTASALDSGGSTTMAFDGKLLNRPSDAGGERPVAEALTLFYYGVYAPAPTARVLSPNADGVDDTQTLVYKLVRPSTVSVTLNGPGGVVVPLDSGSRAPGTYRFPWTGAGQPEGTWTFHVVADDDLGRHSVADRQFALNNTLGFLSARAVGRRVTATFKLARPARVVVRIETTGGSLVRTLATRSLPAGDGSISWSGRPGAYVFSATATNEVGGVELTSPFRLRR